MALIVGDIHGRFDKAKAFLAYKPEEKHVFSGDYVDSFIQSEYIIYDTLKLVIESPATLILGNHDIHYLDYAPFKCSGYREHMAESIGNILETYLDRFVPVAVEDGFVITHGGIAQKLAEDLRFNTRVTDVTIETYGGIINTEWEYFLNNRNNIGMYSSSQDIGKYRSIFNIPRVRGGIDKFGGIFWADYRDEKYHPIPQVFGHSKTPNGVTQVNLGHWALGCDDYKFECFNTKTCGVEDFSGEPTKNAA